MVYIVLYVAYFKALLDYVAGSVPEPRASSSQLCWGPAHPSDGPVSSSHNAEVTVVINDHVHTLLVTWVLRLYLACYMGVGTQVQDLMVKHPALLTTGPSFQS